MNYVFVARDIQCLFVYGEWLKMIVVDRFKEMIIHLCVLEFSLELIWNKLFDYSTRCISAEL